MEIILKFCFRHPFQQILPTFQTAAAARQLSTAALFSQPQPGAIKTVYWNEI
jgi:hypothetical protein